MDNNDLFLQRGVVFGPAPWHFCDNTNCDSCPYAYDCPAIDQVVGGKISDELVETINRQAKAFAQASTNTRCAKMGDCATCQVRFCDYKSRYEAFMAGWKTALKQITQQPNK